MPLALPVAALGLLLLGITLLWLYYNTRTVLIPLMTVILQEIPVIGSWLAQRNAEMVGAAANWIKDRVESAIAPLVAFIQQIASRIDGILNAHLLVAQALSTSVHWLRFTVIPAVEVNLIAFTAAAEQRIGALAQSLYRAATHQASLLVAQALATVEGWTRDAIALTQALHLTAMTAILQQALATEQAIGLAYSQAIGVATDLVRQAELKAANDAAAIAAAASQGFADAERYALELVWGANGAVRQLELELANSSAGTLAQAAAAAGALVLPLALEQAAIRELKCIQQCNPLGQLGDDLQVLDLGIVLAFLLAASAHPKEGAAALTEMLAPGGQRAGAELRALFGG
jgi:hypothetical protein